MSLEMNRTLLPAVSFCLCGGQALFLEIAADRYITLPAEANRAFLDHIQHGIELPEEHSKIPQRLLDTAVPCLPIAKPLTSSIESAVARPKAIDLVRASLGYASVQYHLKTYGLSAALERSANRRIRRSRKPSAQAYSRIIAAFAALSPILGRAENCLPWSMAFHAMALAAGQTPSLVIGVKRDPFAAHCWVQDGATVVNDSVEHVRIFTPILIV